MFTAGEQARLPPPDEGGSASSAPLELPPRVLERARSESSAGGDRPEVVVDGVGQLGDVVLGADVVGQGSAQLALAPRPDRVAAGPVARLSAGVFEQRVFLP